MAPKRSRATVDARMTERSRHLGTLMKAPDNRGTAAPREKQIIEDRAACIQRNLKSPAIALLRAIAVVSCLQSKEAESRSTRRHYKIAVLILVIGNVLLKAPWWAETYETGIYRDSYLPRICQLINVNAKLIPCMCSYNIVLGKGNRHLVKYCNLSREPYCMLLDYSS